MTVKCLNCKKHKVNGNRHTCTANINIYVLGTLQDPIVSDCMEDYEPIKQLYKKHKLKPWKPGDK